MILRIDHIGLVARTFEEATDLLLDRLGFTMDGYRTPMPDGIYMARENADIYFVKVGEGDTRLELLLPRDRQTGMGRWLDRRGPSVHHIAYLVDDVEEHAAELADGGSSRLIWDRMRAPRFSILDRPWASSLSSSTPIPFDASIVVWSEPSALIRVAATERRPLRSVGVLTRARRPRRRTPFSYRCSKVKRMYLLPSVRGVALLREHRLTSRAVAGHEQDQDRGRWGRPGRIPPSWRSPER